MPTEPTQTAAVELVADDQKELLAVATQNGIQPETAQNLQTTFAPLFSQARAVLEKSRAIEVTDVAQKLEIKLARAYRLELRAIRVASEKTRKELKEESLRKGKAIDGFHNILLHLIEQEESRLDAQEKFAERKEQERKDALRIQREESLRPYAVDTALFQLGEMSQETFDQLLAGTKLAHEAKVEAARKAEAERIAREAAEAAEREKMRIENERLRKEAEEREAAMKAERERVAKEKAEAEAKAAEERAKAEAERRASEEKAARERAELEAKLKAEREASEKAARAEREAREKIEAEKRRLEEAQSAKLAAEEADRKKAAAAPDKEKLLAFALAVERVQMPGLSTPEATAIATITQTSRTKFVAWIREKAGAL